MQGILYSIQSRFWLWTIVMLALVLLFALQVWPKLRIETDILSMLPSGERDAAVDLALQKFSDTISRKTLFLVGAPEPVTAKGAAADFAKLLRSAKVFEHVQLEIDAKTLLATDLYRKHRFALLSDRHRTWLEQGQADKLAGEALRDIYNPAVTVRPLSIADDPANLLGNFLGEQLTAKGAARLDGSVLMVSYQHMNYVLVVADSGESAFSTTVDDKLLPVIQSAIARVQVTPGVRILGSGVLLHASAAARDARHDINTVGTVSMVAISLMMLLTFRSLRPLLLSAVILGIGAIAAMTACYYVFGQVHLFALVFGSGLIGVAIDYSTHFLADQFRDPLHWSPAQALSKVGPSIAMGMACAVLGYLGLMLAPLPGLQQMAVFSAVGLVIACSSVLCWYPLLAQPMRKPGPPLLLLGADTLDHALGLLRSSRLAPTLATLMVGLALVGLWRIHFADDVRLLQPSSPRLVENEREASELLQNRPDSRFFLIRAANPQAVIETEEMLHGKLDALVASKALGSYGDISRALPSARRQEQNRQLLKKTVYASDGLAPHLMKQLGFPPDLILRRLAEFASTKPEALGLDEWLSSPVSEPYRHLWLGKVGGSYAGIVSLTDVTDVSALAGLDGCLPGVKFVDRVNDISHFLGRYRQRATLLIAGAYVLIGGLMSWRYGAGAALRLLAVPAGAAAMTLAFFGLLGFDASLFNVLGLFIVLGLGVDYAVFLRESQDARRSTVLAITLSTFGTVLSYGLLALSRIPFIHSLGLTLLIGIGLTYAFALISQRPSRT